MRTVSLTHLVGLVSACLAVGVLVGCSGQAGAPASEGAPLAVLPVGEPSTVTSSAQVVRPIDRYLPSAEQVLDLMQANENLVSTCLASVGAEAMVFPDRSEVEPFFTESVRNRVVRSDLWDFFDTESVATRGYLYPVGFDSFTIPPLPAQAVGACGDAYQALIDSMGYVYISNLPDGGPPVPREHPTYRAAVTAWSQCMAQQGFDYADTADAIFSDGYNLEETPSPRHLATAAADVDCKVQTNLVGIGLAVQSAYDEAYIEQHHGALVQYSDDIDARIRAGAGG